MSTILLVDDQAIFREPIGVCLRQHGYTTHCAASGRDGLELVARYAPDLILLDMAMPGMNGLEFLSELRSKPRHMDTPVILLTAVAEKSCVVTAARLGVKDYMLKSAFSLDEMLARIKLRLVAGDTTVASESDVSKAASGSESFPRACGPRVRVSHEKAQVPAMSNGASVSPHEAKQLGELTPIITREELIRVVNKGLELKPLAPVVQTIMAATANASSSVDDIARAVGQDQALSVRVLKLANGSMYSRGRPVQSLREAIGRIGIREIRHLIMTLGVLEAYEGSISKHMDARLFWEHSVACGQIAVALSRKCGNTTSDDLFLPGTLHDVGRLVLCEHVPDKYAEVFKVAQERHLPLELVESKLMLLDHCNILDRALEHWRFPREFIAPVVGHHQSPQSLSRLGACAKASLIIALANRLTHALLLGSSGNDVIYPIDDLMEKLGLKGEDLAVVLDSVPSATDFLKTSILSHSNGQMWPSMIEQVRRRFQGPARALCLSDTPGCDVHRILLNRIGEGEADRPDVAVLSLSNASHLSALLDVFETVDIPERDALPVLIIYQQGQIDLARLHGRPHCALRGPVRLERVTDALVNLLAD